MERGENSDETAIQTSSSSDMDDDTCHSTENDATNPTLPQLSHRGDQPVETRRVLKQPLLGTDKGTQGDETSLGSDPECARRMDDSDNQKYAEINNHKKKYFQYVLHAYQYSKGSMSEWTEKINAMDSKWGQCLVFIDALLRGVSQIGFVNSPIFGLGTFLVALCTDTWIGLCGMLGCLCTSLFAVMFKLNKEAFKLGLFGFNGYLFGASLAIYLSAAWDWRTIVLTILLAPLTIIFQLGITNILSPYNCPPFGLPLCIVANLLFLALQSAQPKVQAAVANSVTSYEISA